MPKTTFIIHIIFFIFYTLLSLSKHYAFHSSAFDLGTYTQMAYLYSHHGHYSTLLDNHPLATHFEPIMYIVATIYILLPTPATLLVIQALSLSIGAIILEKIIRTISQNAILIATLITSFYTSVGVVFAMHFDFHTETIAILPLSVVLWSWWHKKYVYLLVSSLILLAYKENMPIFICSIGLISIFQKRVKEGLILTISAVCAFAIIQYLLMPSFSIPNSEIPPNMFVSKMKTQIESPISPLHQMINHPYKRTTLGLLFLEWAGLPLLSLIGIIPVFSYTFVRFNADYPSTWSIFFHYNILLEAFLLLATAIVCNKIPSDKLKYVMLTLLTIIVVRVTIYPTNRIIFYLNEVSRNHYQTTALQKIPPDAKVSAQTNFVPHLINRQIIYQFPKVNDAQFIIVNKDLFSYPLTPEELSKKIAELESDQTWEKIHIEKSTIVFMRKNL